MTDTDSQQMDDFIRAHAGRTEPAEDVIDHATATRETLDGWVAAGFATQEAVDAFAAQLTFPTEEAQADG